MELVSARLRAGAVERCPYCHDLLGEGGARITCPSCATEHHVECALELGRCTVLGCERTLEVAGHQEEERRAPRRESPARRAIRERLAQRARSFVRDHARRPGDAEQRLRSLLEERDQALQDRDYELAARAAEAVAALAHRLEPERLDAIRRAHAAARATASLRPALDVERERRIVRLATICALIWITFVLLVSVLANL